MNEKDEKKIIRHFRKERNQILPAKFYTGINLGVVALWWFTAEGWPYSGQIKSADQSKEQSIDFQIPVFVLLLQF